MSSPFKSRNLAIVSIAIGFSASIATAQSAGQTHSGGMAHAGGMAHMSGHMYMTTLRQKQPGDQAKADAIVAAAKAAMQPYEDYHNALADGGYKLIGVMYTDRVDANEDEINNRIPLSIARWHQHTNFCKAPAGQKAAYFGPNARFGLLGSIHSQEACDEAGGVFLPHVFGWMVHVYPYETDPNKIWSVDDDDNGHDNMDNSSMPGMKMD